MEHNLLKLDGRIIVVSGAAGGGIGTTITRLVARAGATVIALSRSQANLDRHIGPLVSQGLSIMPVAADAQTEAGVAAVMDRVRGTGAIFMDSSMLPAARRRQPGAARRGFPGPIGMRCSLRI